MAEYDWGRFRLVVIGIDGGTSEFDSGRMLQPATGNASPPPRRRAALVDDIAHGHVLMSCRVDSNGTMLSDTCQGNAFAWQQHLPANSPRPRSGAALGYDGVGDRIGLWPTQGLVLTFGD